MANAVSGSFVTSPTYTGAGNFIPALWSKKLNAKYYVDNQLTEITNTNWEGDIKAQGDTVYIHTAPTLTISPYVIGSNLSYQVPAPVTQTMVIDSAQSFAFQVNDVLEAQSSFDLMNMFMDDASKQLKIAIATDVYYKQFISGGVAYAAGGIAQGQAATRPFDAANQGATAGAQSGAHNLGTDASPILTSTPSNLLALILHMSAVLDEQNVPEEGRYLLLSPYDRQVLMNTNLAQAYFTGDTASTIRTGKIGKLDRFDVYVSNMLPRGASAKGWVPANVATSDGGTYTGAAARRCLIGGHKDCISFANQVNKTEQVRNPNDFGDFVRGLSVYGSKVVKGQAGVIGVVA